MEKKLAFFFFFFKPTMDSSEVCMTAGAAWGQGHALD